MGLSSFSMFYLETTTITSSFPSSRSVVFDNLDTALSEADAARVLRSRSTTLGRDAALEPPAATDRPPPPCLVGPALSFAPASSSPISDNSSLRRLSGKGTLRHKANRCTKRTELGHRTYVGLELFSCAPL